MHYHQKRQMAFQAWKILKFCHFVIEKSGESSSENFSVIYSFEARITTNASVHHFLSFPRFLNINVLDHTLCWFIFFYRCPKGCSHQCLSLHFCHPCDFDNSTSLPKKSTVVTGQLKHGIITDDVALGLYWPISSSSLRAYKSKLICT